MYLLDTNICIYIINQKPSQVIQKFRQFNVKDIKISTLTACELAFGVEKSGSIKNKIALEKFLQPFDILAFDSDCIWHYAKLRHHLQRQGTPIGSIDMLIASHALALDLTLITNNTDEFSRIPNLKLENWT